MSPFTEMSTDGKKVDLSAPPSMLPDWTRTGLTKDVSNSYQRAIARLPRRAVCVATMRLCRQATLVIRVNPDGDEFPALAQAVAAADLEGDDAADMMVVPTHGPGGQSLAQLAPKVDRFLTTATRSPKDQVRTHQDLDTHWRRTATHSRGGTTAERGCASCTS